MQEALRPFGWECDSEFWGRYHSDPWVFNLANAVERVTVDHQALTALAEYAGHDDMCGASQAYGPITCTCGLGAARAALEAVRGD